MVQPAAARMSRVHFLKHCAECGKPGAQEDGFCAVCRPLYPDSFATGSDRFSDDVDPASPERREP
ncbi:hypothetical protein [Sphingobium sp. MI1205]|uniref:hypothetical protein n=1 Tax=Sphingobium sp. MI1205 TaxID=407020 RepID=UPI00077039EF|nr:hypothetical protein [Sphingobium sp. MI1205]AMK19360.1 hypothetical protein K663_14910 [Sphingobium sp. MI1205]